VKIESDLFELETNSDFIFYLNKFDENEDNRSLFFSRANNFHYSQSAILLGQIECVGGSIEDGIFDRIHEAKSIEVEERAGYIEEPEDEAPFEFSTTFNSDAGLEVHHHLVRDGGHGFVLLLTLFSGFLDPDIDDVRELLSSVSCKRTIATPIFGELIPIQVQSDHQSSRVGKRVILNPLEIHNQ
jgi:hypothetical protein